MARRNEGLPQAGSRSRGWFWRGLLAMASVCSVAMAQGGRAQVVQVEPALERTDFVTGREEMVKIRVALRGLGTTRREKTPLNIAFVLDRSEAMRAHLEAAKAGILVGIGALGPEDSVSIVTFDDTVEVLVEATRVGDLIGVEEILSEVTAGGKAALFAGVVKGAFEARKALALDRVSRVVVLSAGRAEVGPKTSGAVTQIAASLRRDGIAVTSVGVGLGFDEDLLLALAEESGGRHVFVEEGRELSSVIREGLQQLRKVVARDAWVRLTLGGQAEVGRVLGRKAEIFGRLVSIPMPWVQAGESDDIVLEARLGREETEGQTLVATIETHYVNLQTGSPEKVSMVLMGTFVDENAKPAQGTKAVELQAPRRRDAGREVAIAGACWNATQVGRQVVALRNEGQTEQAMALLEQELESLARVSEYYESQFLRSLAEEMKRDAVSLDGGDWVRQRKVIIERTCDDAMADGPRRKRRF